jgi:hypothetical protein
MPTAANKQAKGSDKTQQDKQAMGEINTTSSAADLAREFIPIAFVTVAIFKASFLVRNAVLLLYLRRNGRWSRT